MIKICQNHNYTYNKIIEHTFQLQNVGSNACPPHLACLAARFASGKSETVGELLYPLKI